MDELTRFLNLCAEVGLPPLAALAGPDQLWRVYAERLGKDDGAALLSFLENFRSDAERLCIKREQLAMPSGAHSILRQLQDKVSDNRAGEYARKFIPVIREAAIRQDAVSACNELKRNSQLIKELRDDIRAAEHHVINTITSLQNGSDESARLQKENTAHSPDAVTAALSSQIISLIDFALGLRHTDSVEQLGNEMIAPTVMQLVPMPSQGWIIGSHFLLLIIERLISDLEKHGITPIEIEEGKTVADSRIHRVIETREPDKPELAGLVYRTILPGFRRGDEVIRQPTIISYLRPRRHS